MIQSIVIVVLVLAVAILLLQIALLRRRPTLDTAPLEALSASVQAHLERTERAVREEVARSRDEASTIGQRAREEAAQAASRLREETSAQLGRTSELNMKTLSELGAAQRGELASVIQQLEQLRGTIENRLKAMQDKNAEQLERMRATVDEKLQGTLEKRLGESFKLVGERLEAVYKGLGEMQTLASGVGDLKRVLTNVKTRGTWGEVQLAAILEQVLSAEQYSTNVDTLKSGARVEFAIKLPGRGDDAAETVWLPIDSKFPIEDYQRLIEAQERADQPAAELAGRELEKRVRASAQEIRAKYVGPPLTTDFAILFLPTEGLFAEVVRRPGLTEALQRELHVMVAGPTTLIAVLNSLQMGFRTLAIEKRSSEVWKLLAAVKGEFARYGELLHKVQKKLDEASKTIQDVDKRKRQIDRKLRDVEALPADEAGALLVLDEPGADEPIGGSDAT